MEWKANARRRPKFTEHFQKRSDQATTALAQSPIMISHGKPVVLWTHTRDFVDSIDESGAKTIVASMVFRQGDYIFPKAYLHPGKGIVGEPKDARLTDRGWVIYLDAVLRDKDGYPVKVEGCEIDMSGWYLESDLRDAGLGKDTLRLGAMSPSMDELNEARSARIRKLMELAQTP